MSKRPSFQFYPTDWLADQNVIIMTAAERGVYFQLMCLMWNTDDCSLKSDRSYLARLSGGSEQEVENILHCFVDNGEKITHNRLSFERQKQDNYRDNSSKFGKRGGGNPNFKKGKPNPYYANQDADKDKHKGGDKGGDKGDINSSSSSSSKEEEEVIPKKSPSIAPTFDEFKEYCTANGYSGISSKVWNYYDAANWCDKNGNRIKNWKQKLISVWFTEKEKDKVDNAPKLSDVRY